MVFEQRVQLILIFYIFNQLTNSLDTQGFKKSSTEKSSGGSKKFHDHGDKKGFHKSYKHSDSFFKDGKSGGHKGEKFKVGG